MLHGFNVRDGGKQSIAKLLPYLPGSRVFRYGRFGLIGVYFFNDNIAETLAASLSEGCVVIGHSNAADIIYRALQLPECPQVERVVLIRPALDSDVTFGNKVDRVDVFHHYADVPVILSALMPCSNWGDMGAVGYEGGELHVMNHDESLLFGFSDHSSFADESFDPFVKYLQVLLGFDNG